MVADERWIAVIGRAESGEVALDQAPASRPSAPAGRSRRRRFRGRAAARGTPRSRPRRAARPSRRSRISSTRQSSGKGQPRHDRRRPAAASAAGIDDDAALVETARCRCRSARRAPAASRRRRCRAASRAACAAPRRRQARSACRSRALHGAGWPARRPAGGCGADAETPAQRGEMPRPRARSRALRPTVPADATGSRTVSGSLERQADAAEAAPGAAVQVEKAEMQAGGHSYGDGIRHLPPSGCIMQHHGSLGARRHDNGFPRVGKRPKAGAPTLVPRPTAKRGQGERDERAKEQSLFRSRDRRAAGKRSCRNGATRTAGSGANTRPTAGRAR